MRRNVIVGILAIILLTAISFGVFYASAFAIKQLSTVDQTVAVVSILGVIAALMSARIIANGFVRAKQREVDMADRVEKRQLYSRLLDAWIRETGKQQHITGNNENRSDSRMETERELLLKAGAEVLAAYIRFRTEVEGQRTVPVAELERLIRTMRRDLGNTNFGLSENDLLPLIGGSIRKRSADS